MKKEEIENLFLEGVSPKISKKIQLLRINKNFLRDVNILREKWTGLIDEYNLGFKKITEKLSKIWRKYKVKGSPLSHPLTKKEKDKFSFLARQTYEVLKNKDFNKDATSLAKKHTLYPTNLWRHPLILFIVTKKFFPVSYWLKIGLENHFPTKEIIAPLEDLNFAIEIRNNKETNEPELFIQIFENTILRDLKKNWKLITKCQKKLKKLKGIKKRDYILKNLKIAKKLNELDKKEKSDWIKQEKIYGEIKGLDFGKEEKKRKNRIKQIRHRYKKRIGS